MPLRIKKPGDPKAPGGESVAGAGGGWTTGGKGGGGLEQNQRGGGAGVEGAVGAGEAGFGEGQPAASGEDFAFGADRAGVFGHGLVIGDFQFGGAVALAGGEGGVHGAAAGGVQQGGGVAAVHGADGVVDLFRGGAFEHHPAFFQFDQGEFHGAADAGAVVVVQGVLQGLQAGHFREVAHWGSLGSVEWDECLAVWLVSGSYFQNLILSSAMTARRGCS